MLLVVAVPEQLSIIAENLKEFSEMYPASGKVVTLLDGYSTAPLSIKTLQVLVYTGQLVCY